MADFWHFMTHLFAMQPTRLVRRIINRHEWLTTECVSCGVWTPFIHSTVCYCKESKDE